MAFIVKRTAAIFLVGLVIWLLLYMSVTPPTPPKTYETTGIVLVAAILTIVGEAAWRKLFGSRSASAADGREEAK